jgi:hypothetical protein
MDIHQDTSLKSILENESISLTFKTHIHFCLRKGTRLWLVVRPSIHSFHIAHSIFTSTLCFRFSFIQPSVSSLFTCECGHRLDASNTHLVHCPFGGQWIATHDTIRNVMYAFIQRSGHVIWKERWYALTSRVSFQVDFYMTQEDQIFITDVVVMDPTW